MEIFLFVYEESPTKHVRLKLLSSPIAIEPERPRFRISVAQWPQASDHFVYDLAHLLNIH